MAFVVCVCSTVLCGALICVVHNIQSDDVLGGGGRQRRQPEGSQARLPDEDLFIYLKPFLIFPHN